METHAEPLLVSVTAAAEMLGVSRSTIARLISRGQVSCVRIGARCLVPVSELRRLAAMAVGPSA